eukprot:2221910-Pyramimonas_sp.AAC.2
MLSRIPCPRTLGSTIWNEVVASCVAFRGAFAANAARSTTKEASVRDEPPSRPPVGWRPRAK